MKGPALAVISCVLALGCPDAEGSEAGKGPPSCANLAHDGIDDGQGVLWKALNAAELCAAAPGLSGPESAAFQRDQARLRWLLGDYSGAEAIYKRVLGSNPRDAEAAYGLAEILRVRPGEALAYALASARDAATDRARSRANRLAGDIRLDLGETAAARASFARALELAPDDLDSFRGLVLTLEPKSPEAPVYAKKACAAAGRSPRWARPAAYRLCARICNEAGEPGEAASNFKKALSLAPDDLDALEALGELRRAGVPGALAPLEGEPSAAADPGPSPSEKELERAIEKDPADLEALRLLIAVRLGQNRPDEAAALAHRLWLEITQAPNWQQASAYRMAAEIQITLGDREQAKRSALAAWLRDPGSLETQTLVASLAITVPYESSNVPTVRVNIANARLALGDAAGAERNLKAALELDPGHAHALSEMAQLKFDAGRVPEALVWADRMVDAAAQAPARERVAAFIQRASMHASLKNTARAEADLAQAIGLDPNNRHLLQSLMEAALDRGDLRDALVLADRRLRTSAVPGERGAAYRDKAQIELALGDGSAEDDFRRALELIPEDRQSLRSLIHLERSRGKLKEALSKADVLINVSAKASPAERGAAYGARAKIKLEMRDEAGAKDDFTRALELIPEDRQALRALMDLERARGELPEALSMADRLIDASAKASLAERAAAYDARAGIKRELRDEAGAKDDGARALELARRRVLGAASPGERGAAYRDQAAIELELKDAAGAEKDFRRALELIPDDRQALRALISLERSHGRLKSALSVADGLINASAEASPAESAEAYALRGGVKLALKDEGGAEADFRRGLERMPGSRHALLPLIELARSRGRNKEASSLADGLIGASVDGSPAERGIARREKAQIEYELGNDAAGDTELAQALEFIPHDRQALQLLVKRALVRGDGQRALAAADRLVKAGGSPPELGAAFRARARLRLELKDPAGGEEDFRRALTIAGDDRDALRSLTELALDRGDLRGALAWAERLIDVRAPSEAKQRASAHRLRARILLELKDQERAAKDFDRALELDPEDLEALWSRAEMLGERPREALKLVAGRRPSDAALAAPWLVLRGMARLPVEGAPAAREDMEAAVALNPTEACYGRVLQERRGRMSTVYFDLCLARFPKDPVLHLDRGVARYRAHGAEPAIEDFRAALALRDDLLEAHLSLATALLAAGRRDDALAATNTALSRGNDRSGPLYAQILALQTSLQRPP